MDSEISILTTLSVSKIVEGGSYLKGNFLMNLDLPVYGYSGHRSPTDGEVISVSVARRSSCVWPSHPAPANGSFDCCIVA